MTDSEKKDDILLQSDFGGSKEKLLQGTSKFQKVSRRTIQKNAAKEKKQKSKEALDASQLQAIRKVHRADRAELTIPRKPFVRVIKQILSQFGRNSVTHFSSEAVRAIQLAAEVYLTNMFEDLHILALHAHRVTIMPRDFQTLMRLSSKNDRFSRHGQRAPTTYLKFPTEDLHVLDNFTLDLGEMTLTGIRQEYNLGINLKEQYGDFIGEYKSKDSRFIAGNDNRTIASALALLAGLFPPEKKHIWNPDLLWNPIPVHTEELVDAVSFGVFNLCGRIEEAVLVSEKFEEILDSLGDVRYVIGNLTGINITDAWELDRSKIADILKPPEWARDPYFIEKVTGWLNQIHIFLIDLIEDRSGAWHFDQIVGNLEQYHDTNIMAIARYLKLKSPARTKLQDYGSFLAVELHELTPDEFYVEFWLHPDLNGSKHYVEIEDCPTPCMYPKFRNLRERQSSAQWYLACHGFPEDVDDKCTMVAALAVFTNLQYEEILEKRAFWMMRSNSLLYEQFTTQREKLLLNLKKKVSRDMSALIGHEQTSDVILVASDGRKIPAHLCILRQRAPVFFNRHIAPTLKARNIRNPNPGKPLEVAVGDVDSAGLSFFIKSVYTDDEIVTLGQVEEEQKDRAPSSGRSQNTDKDVTPRGPSSSTSSPKKSLPREKDSGFHQSSLEKDRDEPIMTSFRELASDSPMCTSNYSERSQYDIMEEDENDPEVSAFGNHGRFIRLEDSGIVSGSVGSTSRTESPTKRRSSTKIFPMFIGFTGESEMSQSMPEAFSQSPYSSTQTLSIGSIRGRAMLARRLSVSSLTSLTSIDLTPTTEALPPIQDKIPCSKLAADLLEMYQKSVDTDVIIVTEDGELHAHRCVLWATCPSVRKILKKSNKIELRGFSRTSVDFLLCFLYGGLTCIPDDVEVWEIVALANHLGIDELAQVAALHLKTHKCHFFHRPCATCVSAVFDALPQFKSIRCLSSLFEEALQWQARHFSRIWKGRVFLHLNEDWQKECRDSLISDISEESIIDVLLGCEKLQASLPRIKSTQLADVVQGLVGDVVEYCTDFLISSFDLVVGSKSFKSHGKGLALNLALLEDILPTLIHSLSAETAIRTFVNLRDLLIEISQEIEKHQKKDAFLPFHDYSQRFINLVRRLFESTDKHLLHYAYSVVKSDLYDLLTKDEQQRIEEAGIFVEMKMPRAPPPRLTSFNRTYKRSSSVGIGVGAGGLGRHDRTRSLERSRPIISQVIEASEKEELAREKSFIDTHRRANSMKDRPLDSKASKLQIQKSEEKREIQNPKEVKKVQKSEETKIPNPEKMKSIQNPVEVKKVQKSEETKIQKPEEVKRVQNPEKPKKVQNSEEVRKIQNPEETKIQKPRQVSPQTATKIPLPASTVPSRESESPSIPRKSREKTSEKLEPKTRIHKKGPPPVKKHTVVQGIQNSSEQFLSERQTTRTIITVQQHKEMGIDPKDLGVPTVLDSPKAKPKSVVRPMPKNPSLASTAPVASILPQAKTKIEPVIPASLRARPNSAKIEKELNQDLLRKPKSATSTRTTTSAVRPPAPEKSKRAPVESKIPKVRA
ncbi:hypothetical protein FO519_004890 [Halicephalobus sp. NKZ332]|nr:hypothetical protein FO519_004890 [Halicephalobus sp. NKZ332]